jgi:hypothetical protein
MPAFMFEYAIRMPSGLFYLGPTQHFAKLPTGTRKYSHSTDNPLNVGPVHNAYTYTLKRAEEVILRNQPAFDGCEVVRIL